MSVAIVTKFLGPTNYRGARIVATVPSRIADRDQERRPGEPGYAMHRPGYWRLTISYPYELNSDQAHRAAAQALADRLEWSGRLVGGALADGYAFVFAGDRAPYGRDALAPTEAAELIELGARLGAERITAVMAGPVDGAARLAELAAVAAGGTFVDGDR